MKRGELLALARECPQLHTLRASALGESGKFSARDARLVTEECPSLTLFECDVGVKIESKIITNEWGVTVDLRGTAEADMAATLALPQVRVRQGFLLVHFSAQPEPFLTQNTS